MTSNHHAPYDLGYTRATMAPDKVKRTREGRQITKTASQFGLKAATRLREAGVASNRGSARRGECVPGPCTHRPSHHPSRLHPKSPAQPSEGGAEGVEGKGGEVVTRYPYENVRMDHLLSRENNLF